MHLLLCDFKSSNAVFGKAFILLVVSSNFFLHPTMIFLIIIVVNISIHYRGEKNYIQNGFFIDVGGWCVVSIFRLVQYTTKISNNSLCESRQTQCNVTSYNYHKHYNRLIELHFINLILFLSFSMLIKFTWIKEWFDLQEEKKESDGYCRWNSR